MVSLCGGAEGDTMYLSDISEASQAVLSSPGNPAFPSLQLELLLHLRAHGQQASSRSSKMTDKRLGDLRAG